MQKRRRDCLIFVGIVCLIPLTASAAVDIPVGVMLDLDSSLGSMAHDCINISLEDFYSTNDNYETKLQLHFNDSGNDLLTAASAARDLINNKKVHAIVGPQNSEQAGYVVELGNNSDVPVIWFSPSGPSLLPPRSRFFIDSNSTRSHCSQFEAIAAIIEAYHWQSVIPIYESPEFGNDLIPCLTNALQDMDTRVPYISAIRQDYTDDQIKAELEKIKGSRTYVFVAHMTVELWSRLGEAGMMGEGYAWILTQGLLDSEAKGYMEGALGVRPSLVVSNINKSKRDSLAKTLKSKSNKTLSLYGLWAYDTITALAKAVENAGLVNYNESRVDLRNETGPELGRKIQDSDFEGLSGDFSLRQGQLEPSQFAVYNVKGIIGNWSPKTGLVQKWPGNATKIPLKLKIGVPKTHFTEFVNVIGERYDISHVGGFAVDVFKKVVDVLPFNLTYEFVPVNISGEKIPLSYDALLCHIKNKNVDVDVIIGDITVVANRTDGVDFTMPYLDSSLSMVVKVRSDSKNRWILFEPFDEKLWLILGAIFVGATVTVIILERKTKDSKFKHFVRNPFLIYKSDVDQDLKRRTSKWVVIVVMFLLSIAVQVYTANLTSILTERTTAKASPWRDLQEIKRSNKSVGYQSDSWVRDFLIHQIGFKDDKLKPYKSPKEYTDALFNKVKENRVDAIFDETPYLMFLLKECPSCKMTGPFYKTGGFAFAFLNNSSLVSSFSTAILNVTQDVRAFRDMKNNISLPVITDIAEYKSDVETRSLTKGDFGGLFPIVWSVLALFFVLSILKHPYVYRRLRSTSIYRSLDKFKPSLSARIRNLFP